MKPYEPPPKRKRSLQGFTRTTWAIAWKDIQEAIKNKNTLAVLLTSIAMIFLYYFLPVLGEQGEPPMVRLYDAGESQLTPRLESSTVINVRTYPSETEMKQALMNADVPQLGLTIPSGFDEGLSAGEAGELQGYVLNWVSPAEAEQLRQLVTDEIVFLFGKPVVINLQERVYMLPESHGISTSAAITLVFVITMLGLILTPHLMLEEKITRTIDVLLISPTSSGSLMAGKTIAGLFYCLLGAGVALVVYHGLVLHWGVILLATVLGALFATSVGLLLGSLIDSRAQLSMMAWVFILPLLVPLFLYLMPELVPDVVIAIARLVPTVVTMDLMRAAFAGSYPAGTVLLQLAWLATWAVGLLLMAVWSFRRKTRQPAKLSDDQKEETSATPILDAGIRWLSSFSERLRQPPLQASAVPAGLDGRLVANSEVVMEERSGWRITWAIASKDITATIQNKLALSILLGTAFLLASNAGLSLLLRARNLPVAIAFDADHSIMLRELAENENFQLGIVGSQEEMQRVVSKSTEPYLGLIIPKDFDQRAVSGEIIELEAYAMHWAKPDVVARRAAFFAAQLESLTGGEVQIRVAEQPLYPPTELDGQIFLFTLTFAIILFTMGLALVPLLFVEERQAHTLDALLVSPARISEVVSGKALAGAFYCLLAAGVVFLFNRYLVVHWGVAWLAVLLGAALAVAVGLLVGLISENTTTMGLWGSLILLVMMGLTLAGSYAGISWPPLISILLDYLPTTALVKLLGYSLAGEIPPALFLVNLAALLTAVLFVLGLVVWRLRRMEG